MKITNKSITGIPGARKATYIKGGENASNPV